MKNTIKNRLLVALSALAMALTFPPVNAWIIGFFGLIPFLWSLYTSPEKSFSKGYLFGFIYSLVLVHWLAFNSGAAVWIVTLSAFLGAAFLALNYGFIAWLAARFFQRNRVIGLVIFPLIWTSVEFLRSFGTLGFQWVLVANGQTPNLSFIQIADIGGPFLVSFILTSVNTLLFILIIKPPELKKFKVMTLTALGVFLVIPYGYGTYRLYQKTDPVKSHVFRIVQPNFDSHEKWEREKRDEVFKILTELSKSEGLDSVDIIVWPESATPVYIRTQQKYRNILENLTRESGKILISGVPDYFIRNDKIHVTNSIFVFEPFTGIGGKYSKQKLVPFGEYIPLSHIFPVLSRLNLGQGNFTPGKKEPLLWVESARINLAPMICYESVFSLDAIRKIRDGGEYHILVTNDSWFGNSWGPYQHAAQAVYRAVETRKPLVRCANTGISMAIDHKGRILEELSLDARGILDVRLAIHDDKSYYVQKGNAFAFILLGILAGIILTPLWPLNSSDKKDD
jgi:apolipoprotein N-acyltransferase